MELLSASPPDRSDPPDCGDGSGRHRPRARQCPPTRDASPVCKPESAARPPGGSGKRSLPPAGSRCRKRGTGSLRGAPHRQCCRRGLCACPGHAVGEAADCDPKGKGGGAVAEFAPISPGGNFSAAKADPRTRSPNRRELVAENWNSGYRPRRALLFKIRI